MKFNLIERLRAVIYEFIKPQRVVKPVFEQTHTYYYTGGTVVCVPGVIQVTVFPTGCKGLLDATGRFYIVPPFWTHGMVEYADPQRKLEHLEQTYYGVELMEPEACQ